MVTMKRDMKRPWGGYQKAGNSRFKKGTGCYRCSQCGELTRDTGRGEASVSLPMCHACFTECAAETTAEAKATGEIRV